MPGILLFLFMFGCSADSSTDYTLHIEIVPEGAGATFPQPGSFHGGENLNLKAIPAENYLFEHWEGDLTTVSNPADLTMNSDKYITAIFSRAPLTMGGDGSEANPYLVYSIADLVAIGLEENLDKHYIQMGDIDASGSIELQNGSGFQPIGTREQPFTGSFNGNGYTIFGLFVHNQRSSNNATGFFGYMKNGLIEEVIIDNRSPSWLSKTEKNFSGQVGKISKEPIFSQADLTSTRGVGAFIGFNDGGTIRNSVYMGTAGGHIHQAMGGFAGVNTGVIENSHFNGNLSSGSVAGFVVINTGSIDQSSANGSASGMTGWGFVLTNYGQITNSFADIGVSGTNGAAGFVGYHEGGVITSSYASGIISSSIDISGFALNNNAEINNVHSVMDLDVVDFSASRRIAGVALSNKHNGRIENSYFAGSVEITGSSDFSKAAIIENQGTMDNVYWDKERSGLNNTVAVGSPDGATGLTTTQMTGPAAEQNMPGFDWVNLWRTTPDGYPVLRWEDE
ncbi:MAG: hypothetical protein EA391_04710 [Balneolaceae bacterium]|nr:MAG: hypothetical protein EA391_04710 [Balneolaceae bacterium]